MASGRDGFLVAAGRASPPPPSCSFLGSATITGSGGAQMLSFSSSGAAGELLQRKRQIFSPLLSDFF
jgi:hypothetical protein